MLLKILFSFDMSRKVNSPIQLNNKLDHKIKGLCNLYNNKIK